MVRELLAVLVEYEAQAVLPLYEPYCCRKEEDLWRTAAQAAGRLGSGLGSRCEENRPV